MLSAMHPPIFIVIIVIPGSPRSFLLRPGMKETFASVCLVKDIRPPVFSALLTYIYTDTLQLQRPEDITELLVVANQVLTPDSLTETTFGGAAATLRR